MMRDWGTLVGAAALLVACGDTRDPEDTGTGTAATIGTVSASDTGTDSASGSEGSGADNFDVGDGMGSADDGGNGMGCAKVDFLFVIDNSGSMADEQANLIASFPKFIETIKSTLDMAQSYHIMVADTDAWVFGGCEVLCNSPFMSCPIVPSYMCGVTQPEECEDILGAGVTHPKGPDSSNTDCAFSSGLRYMDTSETDLVGKFSCAARVGSGSTEDPEKPMEAMVQAVGGNGDVATCNQGFLRDDAILVVTFITDEDDNDGDGSNGTVAGWRQALIAAKNGDESAVVVLGLFGDQDEPNPVCDPLDPDTTVGAEPSPRLREFVDSWGTRGFAGSVCAPSYESFFEDAVAVIDTACDEFVPPG